MPEFPVRRFTVDEYHQLGRCGILSQDDNVELLAGWIVPKMIRTPPHDVAVSLVNRALSRILPTGVHVRVQSAITTVDSEPEPDLAVVRGDIRDYTHRHPGTGDVELIVEVAESSILRDRRKRSIYAQAKISHYWILNLATAQLEVYRSPTQSAAQWAYTDETNYQPQDEVPVIIAGNELGKLRTSDLLP